MPNKGTRKANLYDAYFMDELGVENDAVNVMEPERIGLHKSIFTHFSVSGSFVVEWGESGGRWFENMADPDSNPSLKLKKDLVHNPVEVKHVQHAFPFFFSKATIKYGESVKNAKTDWDSSKTINITLLFAVSTEINRLGIRSFFRDDVDLNGIIIITGIEPDNKKGRWGVSIRDTEIQDILNVFFQARKGTDIPYKVVILAAYSTGANGLNQTIQNAIINLNAVKRIVFFDCLYRESSGTTLKSIERMKTLNSNIQIIIYWSSVSEASNSVDEKITKLLVVEDSKSQLTMSGNVIKLAGKQYYHCLILSRMVEIGIHEKFLKLSANAMKAFKDYKTILPPRGKVISDKKMFTTIHKRIPAGCIDLDDWYNTNKKVIEELYKFILNGDGGNKALITQIHSNQLLGWPAGGAETHDLLIPDFGWEYLRLSV